MEQAVTFSAEIHPACLYTDNNGPAVGTELMLASFEKIQHNNGIYRIKNNMQIKQIVN